MTIYEAVREKILKGEYGIGQRIPTESKLAADFSASRITVSRALRDLAQQGYIRRRRGAGSFVCRLNQQQNHLFGWVAAASGGILVSIGDELGHAVRSNGNGLMICKCSPTDYEAMIENVEEFCQQCISQKVSGIFFAPLEIPKDYEEVNTRIAQTFKNINIPVVLIDRDICRYPHRSDFDLVGINDIHAGYVLTEHLINLGHRRIHYIARSYHEPMSTVTARIIGYEKALNHHDIEAPADWIHFGELADSGFVQEIIRDYDVDAFVCANDDVAAHVMRHLLGSDIRVPDDIAVVGMGNESWCNLLPVSITTMRHPCMELADAATRLMLERIQNPQMPPKEVQIACRLVVRKSCGSKLPGNKPVPSTS